jgi:hypothetical protein
LYPPATQKWSNLFETHKIYEDVFANKNAWNVLSSINSEYA